MKRRLRPLAIPTFGVLLLVLAMSVLFAAGLAGAAPGDRGQRGPEIIAGRYIVTLKPDIEPRGKLASARGLRGVNPRHVYEGAYNGFAAELSAEQVAQLEADPDVASVRPDIILRASADTVPTGVRRTLAHRNAETNIGSGGSVDVDVAVIDSGVDVDHPDLNVAGGINCVAGEDSAAYDDVNGHGTHVAGTIGARDNGTGVVGVAPGARIWSVRVLNEDGAGSESDVMCGVQWVTDNAGTIEVANMSLGGPGPEGTCGDGGMHGAICASIAAGVPYVVAAGNSADDAANYVPASYDEVITVSAITDTDGYSGSTGVDSFLTGPDDALANYSNFGADVDIAAPGSSIRSTWPGGYYLSISGTSMASPHVAGAAAIYAVLNPGASPDAIRTGILAVAWDQTAPEGFTGDPDGFAEPLLNVGLIGGDLLPLPTPECDFTPEAAQPGTSIAITCSRFEPSETIRVFWEDESQRYKSTFRSKLDGTATGRLTLPDGAYGPHTVIVRGEKAGQRGEFIVSILPKLRLYATAVKVDATLGVYLKGFGDTETIDLSWVNGETETWLKSGMTDGLGKATISLKIPETFGGTYTLRATGATTGVSADSSITIVQSIATTPTSGKVGTNFEVRVRGFAPGQPVSIRWFELATPVNVLHSDVTSALGSVTVSLVVPEGTFGSHMLRAITSTGVRADTAFRVSPSVVLTPDDGPAGTEVSLAMTGFGANELVNIRWYDTVQSSSIVTSVNASALGTASATFLTPNGKTGSHKVEAVGASSNAKGSDYFYAVAGITLDPVNGPVGSTVTAEMTGYKAGETVNIRWYKTTFSYVIITSTVANPDGTATATFDIPADATLGSHKVEGVSVSYVRATTAFVVE